MGFIDDTKSIGTYEKKENPFIKIGADHPSIIRLLGDGTGRGRDMKAILFWSHWLDDIKRGNDRGVGITCPGLSSGCPVCIANAGLEKTDPRRVGSSRRYATNIYDMTPVRKCSECKTEYTAKNDVYPDFCPCGGELSPEQPSNIIKILAKGPRLFEQFHSLERAVRDRKFKGDPKDPEAFYPLDAFDIQLITNGEGRETNTLAVPQPDIYQIDLTEKLFDIRRIVAPLPVPVIKELLSGADYYELVKSEYYRVGE